MFRHQPVFAFAPVLFTAALAAQPAPTEPGSQETTFIESTDVRVVNVDVYATTKDGSPVPDLSADDFEISEDGQNVELTNFYKVVEGVPANQYVDTPESTGVPTEPDATPNPSVDPRTLAATRPSVPESQRLWLVVYLDNHNMSPINRTRVLSQLNEFIATNVGDGNQGMLVTYDQVLNVHQSFTDNAGTLLRAVDDLIKASGRPTTYARERADLLREIEDAEQIGILPGRIRQYAQSVENDLRFTLEALSEMVRSLAGLPGRKAVAYVSDGLPMAPGKDLYYALRNKFNDAPTLAYVSEFDMTRRLRQLEQISNSNRVSFYTIDATGLQMPSGFSAENRGGTFANDLRSSVDSLHRDNFQNSIRRVALRTGGVPILNTNNAAPALRKVSATLQTYYSLGYAPPLQPDGRYHRIEVKVKRPGVQLRYREGYRAKDAPTLIGESLEAGMRFGLQSNPLQVRIEAAPVEPFSDDYQLLPLTIRIPIGNLSLVPQGEFHRSQIEVYFSALSEDGEISATMRDSFTVDVPPHDLDLAKEQIYRYDTKLQIKPGPQRIAVAVRDVIASKISKVIYPLR